jgi:hypothetical protein
MLRDAVRTLVKGSPPSEVELPPEPAPGRAAWVRVYVFGRHVGARCVELSGTLQDVSERRRLEEALLGA